uniref:Immunoglobulin domain-containing protein n=1 Tax=Hucho hucho TaxID=62062 RepID=A0A4W5JBV3_9TELE
MTTSKMIITLSGVQSSAMRLVSANIGDTVTLHSFHEGNLALYFFWLKQTLGDNPQLVMAIMHNEFKGNLHFSVQSVKGINHLRISDMQLSDSATYYCGSCISNKEEFREGAILIVKGSASRNPTVVQQSVSDSVQTGDSVTLNTETCAGEHSVYWFRHGSGESLPGIIYTHGDRSDQCIYTDNGADPLLLVYCLSSALGLSFILIVVLGSIMYKMNKRNNILPPFYNCSPQARDADSLHYVARNLNIVYSGIRQ